MYAENGLEELTHSYRNIQASPALARRIVSKAEFAPINIRHRRLSNATLAIASLAIIIALPVLVFRNWGPTPAPISLQAMNSPSLMNVNLMASVRDKISVPTISKMPDVALRAPSKRVKLNLSF